MSIDEKEAYTAKAAEENNLRTEAMHQPFESKAGPHSLGEAGFDAARSLCKNALKTISYHRLLATYSRYKGSGTWGEFDAGLSSSEGAMPLDAIDLEKTHESIAETWSKFVGPASYNQHSIDDVDAAKCLHHSVCGQGHGLCKSAPFYKPACKFAESFHHLIKEGPSIWNSDILPSAVEFDFAFFSLQQVGSFSARWKVSLSFVSSPKNITIMSCFMRVSAIVYIV